MRKGKINNIGFAVATGVVLAGCNSYDLMSPPKKPNILFICVDDLKPLLGCYGDKMAISPNIDKLASQGAVMLNNYCQEALCAPSRASVLTGLRPDSTRVWDLKTKIRDINPDVVTMPQYFKHNGYQTAAVGKVYDLRSVDNKHDELSWSVPFVRVEDLDYHPDYGVPALGYYQDARRKDLYNLAMKKFNKNYSDVRRFMDDHNSVVTTECLDVPVTAYTDGAIMERSKKLLKQFSNEDKPFFLAVGFKKPHLPFAAPKKYWDMYDRNTIEVSPYQSKTANPISYAYHSNGELRTYSIDVPPGRGLLEKDVQKELIHGYYACVTFIDDMVGQLLEEIDELGLANDTVVVLWGDHGWHLGDHGMWCKHSNFEQAAVAPLIIRAPGCKRGYRTQSMSEFVDIFPTLCDLANLETPVSLEGDSLAPILKGEKRKVKDYSITQYPRWSRHMGYSLRTERYRLTWWMEKGFDSTKPFNEDLILGAELYDYKLDPLEKVNLAKGHPKYGKVVEELSIMMKDYFKKYEKR